MKLIKRHDSPWYTPPADRHFIFLLLAGLMLFASHAGNAQEKHMVQIKTFDQQLQPYRNIDISINEKEYISMGAKGVAFVELYDSDLPPKSVKIKNEQLEAASWNFSRGTLEVTVRKKSYQVHRVIVRDRANNPLANVRINFNGKKTFSASTTADGRIEIPLALDEKITAATQFTIPGYNVVSLQASEANNILTIDEIKPEVVAETTTKPVAVAQQFQDFDFSKIDSIQSLTVFYAIFKNLDLKKLSPETQKRIDAKFDQLFSQLQQSANDSTREQVTFAGRISDTSFVSDDVKNLLAQAQAENRTLSVNRSDFDDKIRIITEKLESGLTNLSPEMRSRLLSDLQLLEALLVENESKFYKNQGDYRALINALKEKYFNFEDLENKLSESERQRLEEQRIFRQRLFAILSVVLVFGILIVLLIIFGNKLRKQKKELSGANAEIKRMNENLEGLVEQRTALLVEANRELDTFLYRASHDLRTPICSIIGLCNIATYVAKNEAKELFEKAGQTAVAMDRMLKKLRIISEINNPTNYSSMGLLELAEDIKSKFEDEIQQRSVKFDIQCSESITFQSYPVLLKAILFNIIENAVFYSALKGKETPEIRLAITEKDEALQLEIYDNGIGIETQAMAKLFDMFYKGTEHSKGNGLGLYIVQKSVHALGGTITVESKLDHYSKFTIRLPLKKAENAHHLIAARQEELQVA